MHKAMILLACFMCFSMTDGKLLKTDEDSLFSRSSRSGCSSSYLWPALALKEDNSKTGPKYLKFIRFPNTTQCLELPEPAAQISKMNVPSKQPYIVIAICLLWFCFVLIYFKGGIRWGNCGVRSSSRHTATAFWRCRSFHCGCRPLCYSCRQSPGNLQ